MCRQVIIDADSESFEIRLMACGDLGDELVRRYAGGFSAQHRRGAVRIAGADVYALMPLHSLESRPDVSLRVFDNVADM